MITMMNSKNAYDPKLDTVEDVRRWFDVLHGEMRLAFHSGRLHVVGL